jgi:DNA repair protein RadC
MYYPSWGVYFFLRKQKMSKQQVLLWGDNHPITKKKQENYPSICCETAVKYGTDNIPLEHLLGLLLNCSRETAENLTRLGIEGLLDASDEELLEYQGMGPKKLLILRGILSFYRKIVENPPRTQRIKVSSPENVSNFIMPGMRYLDKEYFKTLILDTKLQVKKIVTISIGTLDTTLVQPREVFKSAIKSSARAIILVHNHPSGDPEPSKLDIEVTKRLIEIGKIIGIDVLDHIIIGDGKYKSLKEMNLI